MRVSIPGIRTGEQALAVHREIQRRLEALPGVRRSASASLLPLTGQGPLQPYAFDAETARHWESVSADEVWATPGYFETLGATLLAGRDFTPDDYEPGRRRIVIDDSLARRAFHGNAVGQSLQLEPEGTPESFFEVVGVVGHMKMHDLTRPLLPQIYRPNTWDRFSLVVRSAGPAAEGLAAPVRRELARIDPGIAVEDVRTLESIVEGARGQMRLAATLMSVFGALALALAAIGIYGVFTYAVGERVKEMAIRLALGAAPSGIRRMILARGLRLIAASLGVGALGAALLGRAMGALLYGVSPLDPSAYVLGALLLAGVALLACWIPAARAARVDPLAALRQD
jgi:predicted permease